MNDSAPPQVAFAAILARLDRIDARLADAAERRLLALIATATNGAGFTVTDLRRHVELLNPPLRGELLEAFGPEWPKRLAKRLEFWQGKTICGVAVARIKTESAGVLWCCSFITTALIASEVSPVDDAC